MKANAFPPAGETKTLTQMQRRTAMLASALLSVSFRQCATTKEPGELRRTLGPLLGIFGQTTRQQLGQRRRNILSQLV